MDIKVLIGFIVFTVISLFHLVTAFLENEKWRKITKPLPLLILFLTTIFALPTHPLIYIGAFLGMMGDIFLLRNKEKKFFIIGALFFLLGHFAYISEILFVILKDHKLGPLFYILTPLIIGLIVVLTYKTAFKLAKDKHITLIGSVYMLILLLVSTISLIALLKGFINYMYLGIIGGIFFLASDLILTQATFVKDFKRRDFYIMLPYLLGQVFIVSALVFTSLA